MGQTERENGVQSHLKKAGTPTMGGIIFLLSTVVTSLFYVKDYPKIIPVLFLTLGFGLIGFWDDYLKVVLRRSDGLLAWQKMLCQLVVTGIFAFYLMKFTDVSMTIKVPFAAGYEINPGFLTVPLLFFVVIGTVNLSLIHICSYAGAREKGLVRMEGKDYVVQDGDVILFRFNV